MSFDFDIKTIQEALAVVVRLAAAGKWTVKAHPDSISRPSIEIWPDTEYVDYDDPTVRVVIRAFLAGANPESEWIKVARMLSRGSTAEEIIDALRNDPTLGGAVEDAHAAVARWNPETGSIDIPVEIRPLC